MFRRIELIDPRGPEPRKAGLCWIWTKGPVAEAWGGLQMPRRPVGRNCRFFFTEVGWAKYGRTTIAACQRSGQQYRVITIKEKSVDVIYRDEDQVAVRPKRKRIGIPRNEPPD